MKTTMTNNDILELITRRRRQILVHSIIYYELNENLISDHQWAEWAVELEELQAKYPDISAAAPLAEEFKGFDHSTGQNLPLRDPEGLNTAMKLLAYSRIRKGEKNYET